MKASIIPTIDLVAGRPVVSSHRLAETFGKKHLNVIRDIRRAASTVSPEFAELNFESCEYLGENGKTLPMYNLTRDGFTIVVMGYTGAEAMRLKEAYIRRFNAMEKELLEKRKQPAVEKSSARYTLPFRSDPAIPLDKHRPCTEEEVRQVKGAVRFWSYIEGISYEEALHSLCTALRLTSIERIYAYDIAYACDFCWRNIFRVAALTQDTPTMEDTREALEGLIDFIVGESTWTRAQVDHFLCTVCSISSLDEVGEMGMRKVHLAAWSLFSSITCRVEIRTA
jgi:Rha family phage regulatory protein